MVDAGLRYMIGAKGQSHLPIFPVVVECPPHFLIQISAASRKATSFRTPWATLQTGGNRLSGLATMGPLVREAEASSLYLLVECLGCGEGAQYGSLCGIIAATFLVPANPLFPASLLSCNSSLVLAPVYQGTDKILLHLTL